jgi:nucleoside-diphosphate-sugar epimerase
MDFKHAIVTGASSQIGKFLLPRLQAAEFEITAISRQAQTNEDKITWHKIDLKNKALPASIRNPQILFHIAPLVLLPQLLANNNIKRVISFSSTSRFSKTNSSDTKEQQIAAQLIKAETQVIDICEKQQIAWTIFRPTLIYGCGIDKNVSFIAEFIRRFGFFPIIGNGMGLRQPVHADDLATACLQAYNCSITINKAYNLSGGQTLSYREMVEAIFHSLGKKSRIIPIPLFVFKMLIHSIAWLPKFSHLSTAMITRINQNLCFDHTAAYNDFGYQPRTFNP